MAVVVATNLGWLMKSRGAHAGAQAAAALSRSDFLAAAFLSRPGGRLHFPGMVKPGCAPIRKLTYM
jgi:hypothetical protein